jgi:ketosteroid isomerase-like protein
MLTTKEVAQQLVSLCRAGRNMDAINSLFSEGAVTVEAQGDETMPAVMTGIEAIRGKNQWWFENHTVHAASLKGPFPNGDRFAVIFDFEVTAKAGPMAGKRMRMEEVGLYTVENGRVTREEFFYDMEGASNLPVSPGTAPAKSAAKKKAKKAPKPRSTPVPKSTPSAKTKKSDKKNKNAKKARKAEKKRKQKQNKKNKGKGKGKKR